MKLTDRRILVTGADGFIGSHLTEMLVGMGCRVRALCQYNSFNDLGWLESAAGREGLEIVSGDVRDPQFCRALTRDMDVVFHLAALIAIPYSYQAPASYVDTNVKGTLNMCQAALDSGCGKFIQTSTSEVYGTARYVPMDEKHPLQPQSPYSASKIGADQMALSYYLAFGLPVVVARPFNTYGPRQSARAVLPTLITQVLAGRRTIRVGDLSPTRDFTFVLDTCRGFIALAEAENVLGEVVNIGSNSEISIGAALDVIKEVSGRDVEFVTEPGRLRPKDSEVQRLWCDNTRIREKTGFAPSVPFREGIRLTLDWFAEPAHAARYKPDVYNV